MKQKSPFPVLVGFFRAICVVLVIGMCWLFSDCMMTLFSNTPSKAWVYALFGGFYIGSYGYMTFQLWSKCLEQKSKKQD